jgi:hypothetical protein
MAQTTTMPRTGAHSEGEVPEEFCGESSDVTESQRQAIAALVEEVEQTRRDRDIPPSLDALYTVIEAVRQSSLAATETAQGRDGPITIPAIDRSIHPMAEEDSGKAAAVRQCRADIELKHSADGAKLREIAIQAGFTPGVVAHLEGSTFRVRTRPS